MKKHNSVITSAEQVNATVSDGNIFSKVVELDAPLREHTLQVRISGPATGNNLPIIVFAHGFGSSMFGYDPLVDSG